MSRRPYKLAAVLFAVGALFVSGCGSSPKKADTTTTSAAGSTAAKPALEGEIKGSAAASLSKAFAKLGKDFTAKYPDAKVAFTFDSSKTLADQIIAGAPADLFASADETNMKALTAKKLVAGSPKDFARNRLVIVTKPGNPKAIKSLADLPSAGIISLCGKDVPCGKFAKQALDKAGVKIDEGKVTRGQNATATLSAVSDGDAVAGIVYVTDAKSAGSAVAAVTIPDAQNAVATYPIGVLKDSSHADVANAFTAYVASDAGQATLKGFGFLPPT